MNPNNNEQPDLSLPAPSYSTLSEHPPAPVPIEEQLRPPAANPMPAAMPMPSPTDPMTMQLPGAVPAAAIPATGAATTTNPVTADDDDLIEKEWVEKAKRIVASTQEDPYIESREVSRFKADYIKKRYNKDIKISEA